jgi:hypothetical protein
MPGREHAPQGVERSTSSSPWTRERALAFVAMASGHLSPLLLLPPPELLALVLPGGVVAVPSGDVLAPAGRHRLDGLGRAPLYPRIGYGRNETPEAPLQGRHAAVPGGGRGLHGRLSDPQDRAAALLLEAHPLLRERNVQLPPVPRPSHELRRFLDRDALS